MRYNMGVGTPEQYQWPNGETSPIFPATQAMLDELRDNPDYQPFCIHDDNTPAVVLCDVPEGCVVFPDAQAQPLCHQHWITNGSIAGMDAVVDLSLNGTWSRAFGLKPLFYRSVSDDDGDLQILPFDTGEEA